MTDVKLCKSCGTPASPSARYCKECGAALVEEPNAGKGVSVVAVDRAGESSAAKANINEGVVLYEKGDYEGALAKFEKATEADPTLAAAWSDKGCALGRLGKRDAALKAFNRALEIDPANREASEGKDLCLRMLGFSQAAS
jgi:Flp pilus assembly protein TadD